MTSAATSEGALVRRFEAPTRVVHWTLALPFVLLARRERSAADSIE